MQRKMRHSGVRAAAEGTAARSSHEQGVQQRRRLASGRGPGASDSGEVLARRKPFDYKYVVTMSLGKKQLIIFRSFNGTGS